MARGSGIIKKTRSRRVEKEGMLNIQSLAMRSPSHSSSLKCVEGKAHNEKLQFV